MGTFHEVAGNCRVRFGDGNLEIERLSRKTRQTARWTVAPIPLPNSDDAVRVLAARPMEWLIDLLVCRPANGRLDLEVWRVSPYRLLNRWKVGRANEGERPWDYGEDAEILDSGFRVRGANSTFLVRKQTKDGPYVGYAWDQHDYDVFVSYKTEAKAHAKRLSDALKKLDLRVWFAPEQDYLNYDSAITEAIAGSASYAVIWSPSSGKTKGTDGHTTGWSQAREHGSREAGRPRFYCVVGGATIPTDFLKDRYQQVQLDEVGESRFAEMILQSFRRGLK